ncbi:signal peptidase I [Patescibacteria group bacterium]|nr:signal peptidase I [Patescibacteria group bacterium]
MKRYSYSVFFLILSIFFFYVWFFNLNQKFEFNISAVSGNSMEPGIKNGDLAILKKTTPKEIEVGNIVAINTGPDSLIHRVKEKLGKDGYYLITKGDNNENDDQIIATYQAEWLFLMNIPLLGYLFSINFLEKPLIFFLITMTSILSGLIVANKKL